MRGRQHTDHIADGIDSYTAQAGFDHHLTKPVDPAALTRLLVSMTGKGSKVAGRIS